MIEFKTVCENFNTVFINSKKSNQTLFLNASLEIVKDRSQQASVEQIISKLQQRTWKDSSKSPSETEEAIQKIWEQTQSIYSDSFKHNTKRLDLYQNSINSSTIDTSNSIDIKRKECEELLKVALVSSMKQASSSSIEEPILPILQRLDQQIEKMAQQLLALKNSELFDTLTYLEANDKDEFLSIFIEEENGIIQQKFPKLIEIYELTKKLFTSKKKHKHSINYHKYHNQKTKKNLSTKAIREKLLEILEKPPLIEIEISIIDKLKLVFLKNSIFLSDFNFREFYGSIKMINNCIDEIEVLKKKYFSCQKSLSKSEKNLAIFSLLSGTDFVSSYRRYSEVGHILIVEAMRNKRKTVKNLCNCNPAFMEICLLKIYQIDFFNRDLERSLLKANAEKFPSVEMKLKENSTMVYRKLLEELDTINCKQPIENQRDAYKLSPEIQDFLISLGIDFTHLPTCEEYEKIISTSLLQPIFSKEEAKLVENWLNQLEENSLYNLILDVMFESKVESARLTKQKASSTTKSRKKAKANNTVLQTKKLIRKKSTPIASPQPIQSLREIVPIKKQSVEKLFYPIHVTRWFTNPEKSLQDPKYTGVIQEWGKEACLHFHSFPTVIDELVGTEYSLQDKYDNTRTGQSDLLYGIPGEIEIKGKRYRGFFQYVIDTKSGVCYHRCFNFRNKNFIQDLVEEKVWYPNDFPTLEQSKNYEKMKLDAFSSKEVTIQYDSILQKIHLKTDAMNIVLFKNFDICLMDEFVGFMGYK